MTRRLLDLKKTYYPSEYSKVDHDLNFHLWEIKGADLRKGLSKNRNRRRHTLRVLDEVFDILESCGVRLVSRIYIKNPGERFDGIAVYTSSVQILCSQFNVFLTSSGTRGVVVLDSRRSHQNSNVSFSVFTRMYRSPGHGLSRIVEAPLFGHSENAAGLQFADLLASSILNPMAIHTYCTGHVANIHVKSEYHLVRDRYCSRVKKLQYREKMNGQFTGGVVVCDGILKNRSSALLFGPKQ